MCWIYKGMEINNINQFPKGCIGFIYKLEWADTGKFYIGKKNLYSKRKKNLTKKELSNLTDKRSSKKKIIIKESDWKSYIGSNIELKKDINERGTHNLHRTILHFCNNSAAMTYQEVRYQILNEVLESDKSYNDQILGKFWKKCVI